MPLRTPLLVSATFLLTLPLLACRGGGHEARAPAPPSSPPGPPAGTIEGIVRYSGPDPDHSVDMRAHPLCHEMYPEPPSTEEVLEDGEEHLANVFVYLADENGQAAPSPPAQPVVVAQQRCFFRPRVLGVRVGQRLVFENRDETLHSVQAELPDGESVDVEQPFAGQSFERTFDQPQVMIAVTCSFHPWEKAWVGVMEHPWFAVTGEGGHFTITGVPPGRHRVATWHEKLATLEREVTVEAGGTTRLDLTYPASRAATPGRVD
jgi:plastocyanin